MDWNQIYSSLNEKGYAVVPGVLSAEECRQICTMYDQEELYRSTIDMQRYRFGQGEYKYFRYPLPFDIQTLRTKWYEPLAVIANEWMTQLAMATSFPATHRELLDLCHARHQLRPTPLILRYEEGGFNTLHQDLYGDVYFPFQMVVLLTQQGRDHEGGEFVLVEQVPRAQSKAEVIHPNQGDALIFTTHFRPVKGSKEYYRAHMKHGVSKVKSGVRYAMGIIFHDAS